MSFRPLARQIGLYPQVAGKITVTPIQQFPSPLEVIGLYQKTVRTVKAHVKKFPSPLEEHKFISIVTIFNPQPRLAGFRPLARYIGLYQTVRSLELSSLMGISVPSRGKQVYILKVVSLAFQKYVSCFRPLARQISLYLNARKIH